MRTIKALFIAAIVLASGFVVIPKAAADYYGSRWEHQSICVQNQVSNRGIRLAVRDAVHDMNANTKLTVRNYGGTSCKNSGFDQIIYVRDHNYGRTGWAGRVFFNGWEWGHTSDGRGTWFNNSGVVVKLNTFYRSTHNGAKHYAVHELGHAVGLTHVTWTCASVMVPTSTGCNWQDQLMWKDRIGTEDNPGINVIYSW